MEFGYPWIVVIAIRLIVPLAIFRFPLLGSFLGLLADTFDVVVLDFLGVTDFTKYHLEDKILDTYLLLLMGYAVSKWKNPLPKNFALFLLGYRMVGAAIFEVTKQQQVLFLFPNLFEFFFFYYLVYLKIFKKDPFKKFSSLIVPCAILLVLKLIQEYILHVAKLPTYDILMGFLGLS